MQTQVMSRRQAKRLGLHKYRSLEPCKYGHEPWRYTTNGACVRCIYLQNVKQQEKRKARAAGLVHVTYLIHPEDKEAMDSTARFLNEARGKKCTLSW